MEQKGQDIEGGQAGVEMLLAMTEIVFQAVALSLEGVFVFHLPARPPYPSNLGNRLMGKRVIGGKGLSVGYLASGRITVSSHQLTSKAFSP